jgi:mandelate racemase
MQLAPLTFKSIRARAVVLKLKRPVVAPIATITEWPLILMTSSPMKASSAELS